MHCFQKDSKVITYCISTNTKRHILNPNAYEFTMLQYRAGSEEIVLDIFQLDFRIRWWLLSTILLFIICMK